jgi:menaquinone-dependent protoporphyrinogen oxidase
MATTLIAYSTVDGHTRSICERIADIVQEKGHDVSLQAIDDGPEIDLEAFDKIVIGASIRYGKHRPQVVNLINDNKATLESKPSAFFSVNVVARKPEKNTPDTNPYLQKFLKQITWQPQNLAVFAGKIDYPRYTFMDRLAIRFIMWMTKGPTDPTAVVEFTDWSKVDEFAALVADM